MLEPMNKSRRIVIGLVVVLAAAITVAVYRAGDDPAGPRRCLPSADSGTTSPSGTATVAPQWITRSGASLRLGGKPWRFSGVNMYWLGLDDNIGDNYPSHEAVDNGFAAAAALGARVVRSTTLGVSVGSARSLEPTLGTFNDKAFDSIDYAVASARRHAIRLMIPLTDDGRYYHGGKHTFTNWLGHPDIAGATGSDSAAQRAQEAFFYTDPAVIAAFHAYITHLLTHVNPLTGLALGADPTIAIWETGNELFDAPTSWTQQTAQFVKTLAPRALVADGSASTGKDINGTAYAEGDVDIVDGHFYPTNTDKALSDAAFVAQHQKVYVIGEYPLTGSDVTSWLSHVAASPDISGDLAWSLLPRGVNCAPESHVDGYTFHYPGNSTAEKSWTADLRNHARRMS